MPVVESSLDGPGTSPLPLFRAKHVAHNFPFPRTMPDARRTRPVEVSPGWPFTCAKIAEPAPAWAPACDSSSSSASSSRPSRNSVRPAPGPCRPLHPGISLGRGRHTAHPSWACLRRCSADIVFRVPNSLCFVPGFVRAWRIKLILFFCSGDVLRGRSANLHLHSHSLCFSFRTASPPWP